MIDKYPFLTDQSYRTRKHDISIVWKHHASHNTEYLSHAEVCIVESLKHVAVLIDGLGEQVVGQVQEVQPGECRQNVHNLEKINYYVLSQRQCRLCKSCLLKERYKTSPAYSIFSLQASFGEEISWPSFKDDLAYGLIHHLSVHNLSVNTMSQCTYSSLLPKNSYTEDKIKLSIILPANNHANISIQWYEQEVSNRISSAGIRNRKKPRKIGLTNQKEVCNWARSMLSGTPIKCLLTYL